MENSEGWARPTQEELARFWQAHHHRRVIADPICGSRMAVAWRRFGGRAAPAQKSAGNRGTCGKKDTTHLPHRKRAI